MRSLSPKVRDGLLALALVAGFLASSYVGVAIVKYPAGPPASWMGSSFLICAMVMLKGRLRLLTTAICLVGAYVSARLAPWPVLSAVIFTVFTLGESMMASWLLLRLSRTPRLANVKQAAQVVFLVILPTVLAASVAAGAAGYIFYGRGFNLIAGQWFAGHFTGMVLSLPTLLVLATPGRTEQPKRHPIETALLVGLLLIFASAPFNALNNVTFLLILPAATVFAFRLGLKVTVLSILMLTSIGDLFYYLHPNPAIWGPTLSKSTLILIGQAYSLAVYLNGLLTGLAVNHQARLKQQLERRTAMSRAARSRALVASRAKTEFLATMSHEVRTPLNGVLGFTQVLLRRRSLGPDDRRDIELIAASGQALLSVVNDILDFSKVEAGQVALDPRPVRLASVWQDVCAVVRPEAQRKGLDLILLDETAPDGLHEVDDQRLRQVLLNLLNNAVKFTAEGSVTLATAWRGDILRIEVRDTGPGIEAEGLPRLFHRFSQVDSSISRSHGGTGLGLAISKGLIELMGGRIGVQSEPAKGSTFWVELSPVAVDSLPEATEPARGDDGASTGLVAHVLLVDDHAVNRQLGVTVLNLLGCTVDVAENGLEAVEAARTNRYDLIFMDVHMPLMDGLEAARAIRGLAAPSCQVPIVSMSADVMSDQVARCTEAGMNDSVSKPIELSDLQACLTRWIGRDVSGEAAAA